MTTALWSSLVEATDPPHYRFGTHRSVPPGETLRRIRPLLPLAGITRLADVTGLDWIGMPVYQAIRPNSRNISVSQGKGLTRSQAKVSALMESLESFHAEEIRQASVLETLGSMRRRLGYDPYTLPTVAADSTTLRRDLDDDPFAPRVGRPALLRDNTPIDWVSATDLVSGTATWLPKQLCELNFCVDERLCPPLFRASSNGLSSGNTTAEAIVHGLCEVIERDSLWRVQARQLEDRRRIDIGTIRPRLARQVLERFASKGMHTRVVDATGPTGVPCFAAYLSHVDSPGRYFGAGCHPNRVTALLRALTEAAQSRLGHIAGSRDDLFRRSYQPSALDARTPAGHSAARSFGRVLSVQTKGWFATTSDLVRRIVAVTGMAPMAVDLRRADFGMPVVMVVAPGLRLVPPSRR